MLAGWTYTRIAMIAALVAELWLPFASEGLAGWARPLFWPAEGILLLGRRLGGTHPAWFPMAAAIQFVVTGLLIDLVRRRTGHGERVPPVGRRSPLAVWDGLLIVLLTLTSGTFVLLHRLEPVYGAEEEILAQRRARQEAVRRQVDAVEMGGSPRVLVLGDSLCQAALLPREDASRHVSKAAGFPVQLEIIAVGGMDLIDVESRFDVLLESRPDVLVIESNLLFAKSPDTVTVPPRSSRWATLLSDRVTAVLADLGVEGPKRRRESAARASGLEIAAGDGDDAAMRWRLRAGDPSDPNLELAGRLLRRARESGIATAIVRFPLGSKIPASASTFLLERWVETLHLATGQGAALLWTDPIWPDDAFLDGVHLNGRGRDRFLRYFETGLASLLNGIELPFDQQRAIREFRMLDERARSRVARTIAARRYTELRPLLEEAAETESEPGVRAELRAAIDALR